MNGINSGEDRRCGTCVFYDGAPDAPQAPCRARPPIPVRVEIAAPEVPHGLLGAGLPPAMPGTAVMTLWPTTEAQFFCGEWAAAL